MQTIGIPTGSSSFTYEIAFYNIGTGTKALIGSGYYHNNNENYVWITPINDDNERKTVCTVEGATSDNGKTYDNQVEYKHKAAWTDGKGAIDDEAGSGRGGKIQKDRVDGNFSWDYGQATTWFKNNNKSRYKGYWDLKDRYETLYKNLFSISSIDCPWTYGAVFSYYKTAIEIDKHYNYTFVMRKNGTGNTSRALYLPNNNQVKMEFWGNYNIAEKDKNNATLSISEGTHTISVTYDSSTKNIFIYLDGAQIYTATKNTTPNTLVPEITVGAVNYSITSLYCDGGIDLQYKYLEYLNSDVYSVRIYNTALTSTQIATNYVIDDYRF